MTDKQTLLALAERVEKAADDDGVSSFIITALVIVNPEPPSGYKPRGYPAFSPEWEKWCSLNSRVRNLVQYKAFLEAAMTLVPEGAYPTIDFVTKRVWLRDQKGFDLAFSPAHGFAATVPLSICAAALRARAGDGG